MQSQKVSQGKPLRIWAFGDCHVGTDSAQGRESLSSAILDTQKDPEFDWDIAIDVGDMSGGQDVPEDSEGEEIIRQFGALRKHRRADFYSVCGNHDRSGLKEKPAWWWRKWIDPLGENTQYSRLDPIRRPYPVQGTWEHYSFRVGNILFLMMSDINEPSQSKGRGDLGGNPAGVVSAETFRWWTRNVEGNPDSIIISVHHYMLKNTTVASGEWEGLRRNENGTLEQHYHGYKPEGAPKGASYLHFVGGIPDAHAFEDYLEAHPGSIDLWLGGHTHTHPEDNYGGKRHIETRWGVHFMNVAAITKYHGKTSCPMSRHLTFQSGSDEVLVRCFLHDSDFAPKGWYAPAERKIKLSKAFQSDTATIQRGMNR